MASLRTIAACSISKKNFEVVRDFFGYQTGAPVQVSLLRQMQLAQGNHVLLNLIRVGVETFTEADEQEIDSAVAFMRDVYATVDFGVGHVQRRAISADKAGSFQNIGSDDEALELTQEFAIDDFAIDIFFVRTYAGSKVGSGPLFGPLDKGFKGEMCGVVLALESTPTVTGFALAQLVCRYLGLEFRQDPDNLMFREVPNGGALTAGQGDSMANGAPVFFACDEIEIDVLTGGHFRSGARDRQQGRESPADRRPTPSRQVDPNAGNLRRAARDHVHLRAAALGAAKRDRRAQAVSELAAGDDPRRVHDLETIARDEKTPIDVRQLAAFYLGRIDSTAARTALLALLDFPSVPAGTVAQSLGRIGGRAEFDALSRITATWTGRALKQARFAMRLIAHRWDLDFPEPGDTQPELVPLLADDMRNLVWRPSTTLATQIALQSLTAEPFGIELDDRTAQLIQCAGAQFVFLLNRAVGSPVDVQTLLHRKTIAGILARQSLQSGLYDVSMLVLTTPRAGGIGIRIACFAPNGTLILAGAGLPTAAGLAFESRSVKRRGAFAANVAAVLGAEGFAVTTAQSGRLLRDVERPEPPR